MCIEDIRIARATKAYQRKIIVTGGNQLALSGNSLRFAILLPTGPAGTYNWTLGEPPGVGGEGVNFMTGLQSGAGAFFDFQGIILRLKDIGDAIRMPLTLNSVNIGVQLNLIEVLFTADSEEYHG